jgi:hypothetical protein
MASKMILSIKVVKIGSKINILLPWPKLMKQLLSMPWNVSLFDEKILGRNRTIPSESELQYLLQTRRRWIPKTNQLNYNLVQFTCNLQNCIWNWFQKHLEQISIKLAYFISNSSLASFFNNITSLGLFLRFIPEKF